MESIPEVQEIHPYFWNIYCSRNHSSNLLDEGRFKNMARKSETVGVPLTADGKDQLLAKLQGSPHFEKTITASTASSVFGTKAGPTMPAWFVQKNGHKMRRSVLLRTNSPTKSNWPVTLSVYCFSPTWVQVKISGGWQAFATFHGLQIGDSVVFALTAMSEFEVHVFHSMPKEQIPSQSKVRELTCDSNRSQKKPKLSWSWGDVPQLVGSSESKVNVHGLNIHVARENPTFQKVSLDSPPPSFEKILTANSLCRTEEANKTSRLETPQNFFKLFGSRI